MTIDIKIADKKSPYLFLIKFLLTFVALYLFFPFYRGLTGEGGKMYSSFLADHFNLVRGLTKLLIGFSKLLLQAFGYDVFQRNYHSLKIGASRGVIVNPSCLGWAVMSFWFAFVSANKGNWKYKLKWVLTGLSAIMVLNITRIALIALANHLNWSPVTSLDYHQTFNVASYGCIILLIFLYVRMQKKYERTRL